MHCSQYEVESYYISSGFLMAANPKHQVCDSCLLMPLTYRTALFACLCCVHSVSQDTWVHTLLSVPSKHAHS
jgi:hypothetical protein